jgi:hypothetical protein
MNTTQKYEDMPLQEKVQMVQWLTLFPALTIMVFIRRKVGYRMLKSTWLVIMAAILFALGGFASTTSQPHSYLIYLYALAMLGAGFYQRQARWSELCAGVRWHTRTVGISYLEYLPLPHFLLAYRRVYRFGDTALCFAVGVITALLLSHILGAWIMFSAFALYIFEQAVYEKELERDLDTLDCLITSEVQGETVEHFDGAQPGDKQRTLEETAGIPTGIAPDVSKQIEARRAKQRKSPPDNLVPALSEIKTAPLTQQPS